MWKRLSQHFLLTQHKCTDWGLRLEATCAAWSSGETEVKFGGGKSLEVEVRWLVKSELLLSGRVIEAKCSWQTFTKKPIKCWPPGYFSSRSGLLLSWNVFSVTFKRVANTQLKLTARWVSRRTSMLNRSVNSSWCDRLGSNLTDCMSRLNAGAKQAQCWQEDCYL